MPPLACTLLPEAVELLSAAELDGNELAHLIDELTLVNSGVQFTPGAALKPRGSFILIQFAPLRPTMNCTPELTIKAKHKYKEELRVLLMRGVLETLARAAIADEPEIYRESPS